MRNSDVICHVSIAPPGVVLLLTCANVANLLICAGLFIRSFASMPIDLAVRTDRVVLLATLVISVSTGLVFGLSRPAHLLRSLSRGL